jgi:hypothetical protein
MLDPAQRFHTAVSVLCGHGDIKQRLVTAYQDNLEQIDDNDLPPTVRQPFADLRILLHRVAPLNGEGPVRASVRKMSVEEADQCARMMVDMHADVMRSVDDATETLPLDITDQAVTAPPFLVKSG